MYIPMNIKTEYSLLDSIIKVKELVKFALDNNLKALAITDNNLYGIYEFYLECTKNNIKPIIGLEITIDDKKILLYAKSNIGYKNLIKINRYEKDINNLKKYNKDILCIVPYDSLNMYDELNKIYEDIYVGYKDSKEEKIPYTNKIYIKDIYYLKKQDKIFYMYLKGIKDETTINNINIKDDYSLEINDFDYQFIYDKCNVEIKKEDNLLPKYDVEDSYKYLKEQCKNGLKRIFGDRVNKIYIDRVKYELDIINKMGFSDYFLVVSDYVKFAKDNNILVGPGRGSASGSLVSYLLDITEVDPIKYNLLFERFLNPNRVTMPDIDIDFEFQEREKVINYCKDKYGVDKVSYITTFTTLGSRQVLRDVSKVMDLDQNEVDSFIKLIDSRYDLRKNLENVKIKNIISKNKNIKDLYNISLKLEGIKRHTSIHAAGIIISNKNLDDVIPVVNRDNELVTCYTKDYLEDLGLLKMDFLALKNLTLIKNVISDINIDINDIPLNDPKTYELFSNGNVLGIFQFESEGMKNFLRRLKPNNIEDLSLALALYRPGPMSNIDTLIKRREGKQAIDYIDSRLESILKPTYGIIVYQEQIMKISQVMANYTLGEADILRRAISKKKEELILKEKERFINNSIDNNYTKEISEKVFNLILKFASYGFNRSHAVAYSLISYKMAYLKANYPSHFMKCLLDDVIGTSDTKNYILEARINNVDILPPDINKSGKEYIVDNNKLIYPLTGIKGLNYNLIDKITNNKYTDIFDFITKIYEKNMKKEPIISLIDAGCFDSMNYNHKTLINNLDNILNYASLYLDLKDETMKPNIVEEPEFTKQELLERSLNTFGFYLTNHPVTDIKANHKEIVSLNNIEKYFDKDIMISVIVDRIKTINTKKNEEMSFLYCSDEFDSVEVILFPEIHKKYFIKVKDILLIKGKVEKRFDKYQIVASNIKNLTK